MTGDLPLGLQTLVDKLKFKYRPLKRTAGFDVYEFNLSDWNLSLTASNPCLWVKAQDIQAASSAVNLANRLYDAIRELRWDNQVVLVYLDGTVPNLRDHLGEAFPSWVLIDEKEQQQIARASSPSDETVNFLLTQMNRLQLLPYETNKPVTGSRFFGRKAEIDEITRHPNNNYVFIGIRRIGKTSLLKETKRRIEERIKRREGQIAVAYVDCSVIETEEEFLTQIAYALDQAEYKQFLAGRASKKRRYQAQMFERFAALHGGTITYMLDEVDRMIGRIGVQAELFDVLRAAWNAGFARFVLAGFVGTMRAYTDGRSAFHNFMDVRDFGSMGYEDVRRMIVAPMKQLHLTLQDPDAITQRIFRETSGLPNYVQHYCDILSRHLDHEGRSVLKVEDIEVVYTNRVFRDSIVETFKSNTEVIERAIVYALVAEGGANPRHEHFTERTIDVLLKKRKFAIRKYEDLKRACNNLERAGVLKDEGRGNYAFAVPLLRNVLYESGDVEFMLEKAREELLSHPSRQAYSMIE